MKSEIRTNAASAIETALLNAMPGLTPVRVGKKDGYAIDTGVKDENGNPIYAVVDITIKNPEATKTAPAFDFDAAVAARTEHDNQPKKEAKSAEPDPEKEARAAKRNADKETLLAWCVTNLSNEPLTATDIKEAVPEMESITIMQVGTYLKAIAAENPSIVNRALVNGKVVYTRA